MNKNKKKILTEYLNQKRLSVAEESNIKGIEIFSEPYLDSSKKKFDDFRENELVSHLNNIKPRYSVGSMNRIKVTLKNLTKWYFKDKYIKYFPNLDAICKTQKAEGKYSTEDMLEEKDVEKLVQFENTTYWKCYWLLLFYGGFRPLEVCRLKWSQITFAAEGCFIEIYVGKNNKKFTKYIPENVVYYLKLLQNNKSEYVFPSKIKSIAGKPVKNEHLTPKGVYQRLRDLSIRVLGKKINPYVLRHSVATILYNRDDLKDSETAQQMAHSVSMKETYNQMSKEQQRNNVKKIYIKSELTPEKKKSLEEQIAELKAQQQKTNKALEFFNTFVQGKSWKDIKTGEITKPILKN